jgi:hypothetical protein
VPDEKTVLIFSYVGYEDQEVKVKALTTINVSLKPGERHLEEVVVTGYGTQKKKDLTGSVATIQYENCTVTLRRCTWPASGLSLKKA